MRAFLPSFIRESIIRRIINKMVDLERDTYRAVTPRYRRRSLPRAPTRRTFVAWLNTAAS